MAKGQRTIYPNQLNITYNDLNAPKEFKRKEEGKKEDVPELFFVVWQHILFYMETNVIRVCQCSGGWGD